jgi:hypothetical protein
MNSISGTMLSKDKLLSKNWNSFDKHIHLCEVILIYCIEISCGWFIYDIKNKMRRKKDKDF